MYFQYKHPVNNCNKKSYRYKLHLVVLDNTSNTKLMVFDNLAVQLVNKPCLQIAGPSDKVEVVIQIL